MEPITPEERRQFIQNLDRIRVKLDIVNLLQK